MLRCSGALQVEQVYMPGNFKLANAKPQALIVSMT